MKVLGGLFLGLTLVLFMCGVWSSDAALWAKFTGSGVLCFFSAAFACNS